MKSNTYAAFLILLLLIIYPLVNGIEIDGSKDMTRFIPDDALLYIEQHHASKALKEFTKSPLGKKFESIDFLKTGQKIGLTDSALLNLQEALSVYKVIKNNKILDEILGKGFATAILPPIDVSPRFNVKEYLIENAIVIANPKYNAGGFNFFIEIFNRYDELHLVSTVQYGNHHIRRIQIEEKQVSLVILKGFFVMSLNEKQLRRCIDTFDGEVPALANNSNFASIKESFSKADRFLYFPVDGVRQFITKQIADQTFTGKDLLLKEMATTIGFANFGYGSWSKKKRVIDKVLVQYNRDEINSVVQNHVNADPSLCSMLSLTTENPMAFYWSNTIKMQHILEYFKKSRKVEPEYEDFSPTIKRVTGINIEDIFSLLGEEISMVLEPGPKDNFFSFPLAMFFLRVNNVQELSSVMEKIIDEYDIPVSIKSYGPVRYTFWTPSPQDGLQPLYGFWDDLIFFGNSSSLLKMVIDRNVTDFSLMDDVVIGSLDPGFTEKNNSITYIDNVTFIKVLQKWLGFIGMTLAIENRETAYKVHTVLDEIINPLLDGASMYEKSFTRSYFTPEMVIIDSITTKNPGLIKKRITNAKNSRGTQAIDSF
jgi:hypothetical protein